MEFTITVEVKETVIADIANQAIKEAFEVPRYNNNPKCGYQAIKDQVNDFIKTLDVRDMIQDYAIKLLQSGIVAEVTEQAIRGQIKATINAMKKDGTLFAEQIAEGDERGREQN